MDFSLIKQQLIKEIENFILDNFYNNLNILKYNKEDILSLIKEYIKNIHLTLENYEDIKNNVTNKILTRKLFAYDQEIESITKILSNKINNFTIEFLNIDQDPAFYFDLKNNQSYLINYDSINEIWYLSLIETTSFSLIKEIYNNKYPLFISFLKNTFKNR